MAVIQQQPRGSLSPQQSHSDDAAEQRRVPSESPRVDSSLEVSVHALREQPLCNFQFSEIDALVQ